MKKKVVIALVSIFSITSVIAQHTTFGVKAGINVASLETSGDDFGAKVGLHVGGLAHIHINRNWAIQPELVYSMQGGKEDNTTVKFDYLNIPFLIQYMTDGGLRLQTGPQLGFMTTGKTKTGNVEVDIKDDLSSTDFSWSFGLGYLFPEGFGVDARYNIGLTNVNDDDDFTIKNRVFQIGVFYQFMNAGKGRRK